jgi:hypothetical protein
MGRRAMAERLAAQVNHLGVERDLASGSPNVTSHS